MVKVGITGGIGSGKTVVTSVFQVLGIPVYYADDAAKRLMNENPELKAQIVENFSELAYARDGKLDRKWMAEQVFGSKEKLALLNSIVHPATILDAQNWMNRQQTPYAIKEAALIFESGAQTGLDYVIGVSAPDSIRIRRVMKRDSVEAAEVQTRMDRQMNESAKMSRCDFVITNDDWQPIIPQVMRIHEILLAASLQKT
jgi:dephospho-CoA kinase